MDNQTNNKNDKNTVQNKIEIQQQQHFLQSQLQFQHTITYPHKSHYISTNHKQQNNLKCMDKLLIISSIIAFTCAFFISYYTNLQKNQLKILEIQRNKWDNSCTNYFFTFYDRYIIKQKMQSYDVQYLYPDQLAQIVQYLIDENCQQFQYSPFIKQQKQQKQQNNKQKMNQQQQQQQQQQIGTQQIQLQQQKQQEYFEKIKKINQQQKKQMNTQKPFQPISGIGKQKLQNANKYKNFIKLPPWQCNQLCQQQYLNYDSIYHIGKYTKQLPFCIVVPTFNNQPYQRYKNNINSITQQNYTNYHIVIINDASTDNTGTLLSSYSQYLKDQWAKRGKSLKIDIYHNTQQQRAMPNLRKAALQYCLPQQIFVIVDGDDYLIGKQVFKLFNSQFQEYGSWFVYSNFISFTGTIGYSRNYKQEVIEQNRYRKANFATSHLRAFYTKLFQLIKQQDLKDDNGQYFRAANDVAICIPILQMSHRRIHYIPQITYLYNSNTGLNNHMVRIRQQIDNSRLIRRNRSKYEALQQLPLGR